MGVLVHDCLAMPENRYMRKHTFTIHCEWDEEASVWYVAACILAGRLHDLHRSPILITYFQARTFLDLRFQKSFRQVFDEINSEAANLISPFLRLSPDLGIANGF